MSLDDIDNVIFFIKTFTLWSILSQEKLTLKENHEVETNF